LVEGLDHSNGLAELPRGRQGEAVKAGTDQRY
jgi:hypothetical protein